MMRRHRWRRRRDGRRAGAVDEGAVADHEIVHGWRPLVVRTDASAVPWCPISTGDRDGEAQRDPRRPLLNERSMSTLFAGRPTAVPPGGPHRRGLIEPHRKVLRHGPHHHHHGLRRHRLLRSQHLRRSLGPVPGGCTTRPRFTGTRRTSCGSSAGTRTSSPSRVSRRRYCNRFGVRPIIAGDMSLITLDGEEHTRHAAPHQPGLHPGQVRKLIPHVRELTQQMCDEIGERHHRLRRGLRHPHPTDHHLRDDGPRPRERHQMYRWSDAMMDGDGHIEEDDPGCTPPPRASASTPRCARAHRRAAGQPDHRRPHRGADPAFDEGKLEKENALQGVAEPVLPETQLDNEELLMFIPSCSSPATRPPATRSPAGCRRSATPSSGAAGRSTTTASCPRPSRRCSATSPRSDFRRTVAETRYTGMTFEQGDGSSCCTRGPTGTRVFDDPAELISTAIRTPTWRSASATTSAWARTWPAWRSRSSSRSSSAAYPTFITDEHRSSGATRRWCWRCSTSRPAPARTPAALRPQRR